MSSVSIVIATSGRLASLGETLSSLAAVTIPEGMHAELLLVENVVRSGAEQSLRAFPNGLFTATKYFFEPRRGKAHALNLALANACGEILLFTDDDVRFPPDWIERMCEPIVNDRADAVAGGVRLAPHLLRLWMNHTHRAWLASTADYLSPGEPSEMCGANMTVSRRVFDRIGCFEPELGPGITGGGEETLLSWQIRKAGFRLMGALDIEVEHHFDSDRLRYKSWSAAARLKGETRAYHVHHWFHQPIRFARIKRFVTGTKLVLRKLVSPRRDPDEEGIAPWELSYLEDIAMYTRYTREQYRPRRYSSQGLRDVAAEREPVNI